MAMVIYIENSSIDLKEIKIYSQAERDNGVDVAFGACCCWVYIVGGFLDELGCNIKDSREHHTRVLHLSSCNSSS